MNFCYGPMTKNVVDTVIQYSLDHPDNEIIFIPSRRQIEYNGGYVNNWTTREFVEYVKSKNNKIKIERDHGGPNQGLVEDDGFVSLTEDAKYMDIIHIDPWKKYNNIDEGIETTIKMINHCYNINKNLLYEICTEEAIRPFSLQEIEYIINVLQQKLDINVFNQIKYLVIQCGTKLSEGKNHGLFDERKLLEMLEIANKYNMTAKEHNGDWVSLTTIKKKHDLGLKYINIAPELGEIESRVILNKLKQQDTLEDYRRFYKICVDSGKWKKWVKDGFDVENKKDEIILICGHYNLTDPAFIQIKERYRNIDKEIQECVYDKLLELNDIYSIRKKCIFCNHDNFELLFENKENLGYVSSLSLGLSINKNEQSHFMPYNIQICKGCNSVQNKYIGNLSIIYNINHIDDYGSTKNKKHTLFGKFITENKNMNGIIEVGSCNGILARNILNDIKMEYNIIEPSFIGDKTDLNIIPSYFENVDLSTIQSNTVIMSDVFEHFYHPIDILEKIKNSKNIKYIYLNHPDFDYSIKNNIFINLNSEHTFLIEHQFLFALFENNGFRLNRRYDFENFSLFLEFERIQNDEIVYRDMINKTLYNDTKLYFENILTLVSNINNFIDNYPEKKVYIWPSSVHSITLFTCGLKYEKLSGILDNSPNKIGKYLYGYNLLCSSFNDILKCEDNDICIIISSAGSYTKELVIENKNIDIHFLKDFI
jgi:hypothetical protein